MPHLTPEYETTVPNLFIVGELGGLALIKNAVNQGRDCVDTIAARLKATGACRPVPGVYDVLIVGAGPAGISASLRAIETQAQLPHARARRDRRHRRQVSAAKTGDDQPRRISHVRQVQEDAAFQRKPARLLGHDSEPRRLQCLAPARKLRTSRKTKTASSPSSPPTINIARASVILALGRAGEPRKLGVKGEELPKVMYRLIEADHYINKKILVVGGGDSAVEAAMGLANQAGNQVTLSYRSERFSRIKERNAKRIEECMRSGKVSVLFNSNPVEFKPESVILDVNGSQQEIPNDFVWIFAGGTPPTAFLKKIGVGFGARDLTLEASREAKQANEERKQFAQAHAAPSR